jgi:hypothetical protein
LADLDGDGTNEIFVGLWDGDSGYIEVFSGLNAILIKRSEKLPAHKIVDLDVGDIDGDHNLEVVVGADTMTWHYVSWVCLMDAEELHLQWKGIVDKVKSVEVEDVDNDDTAEVYVGTHHFSDLYAGGPGYYYRYFSHSGSLYYFTGKDTALVRMSVGTPYWRLAAYDIDRDSYNEIVCGVFQASLEDISGDILTLERIAEIYIIEQDRSLSRLCTLYENYSDLFWPYDCPYIGSIAIGNCDDDDEKEIVSYLYCSFDLILFSVADACSGTVQNSMWYWGVEALALFDVDAHPPDEILVFRTIGEPFQQTHGVIEAIDGEALSTRATAYLSVRRILLSAFGDVTEDAMPEICITDGDSLFLYGFGPTGVEEENEEELASAFVLHQNFPNPFNPQTTIRYYLPQSSNVVLSIYNVMGQKVKTLVNGPQPAGYHSVTWDGTDKNSVEVASGVYFYRVNTDYSEETKKMVLLK